MQENHIRFADKYFETLNAKESAIYAGFSADTAKQGGYQLLQREDIQDYLAKLKEEAERKHGITKDKWLSELAISGFSNIQDFIDSGNTVRDISTIERDKASAVSSIKKTVIEGEFGVKETVEFKLNDKLAALDKIGRHLGYFEKDNAQSKPDINVSLSKQDIKKISNELEDEV